MRIRRKVGDAHVDRAQAAVTPFTADFQDLLTRYAWGEIWTRPGLDLRTRSCITVAMLVALNRPEELALHVRGALNNGVTREELREVLLQSAVYCGVPAANAAFKVASELLALRTVAGTDSDQNFRDAVRASLLVDPRPTFENLAANTGLTYEEVVHHALVRYASSGAEALLAIEPQALRDLIAARKAGDWEKVAALIDWLEAGLESPTGAEGGVRDQARSRDWQRRRNFRLQARVLRGVPGFEEQVRTRPGRQPA